MRDDLFSRHITVYNYRGCFIYVSTDLRTRKEVEMKKFLHPLVLIVTAALILASCSLATESVDQQSALPVIQNTALPNLADKVGVELTVQYDTAAQYNTVNQIVRFKYIIKVLRNDLTDATPANISISGITPVCPAITTVGNANDRLDAGEVIECAGDYILTQADLDRGSVQNTAVATVYTVNSNQVITTVPTIPAKAITLTKAADPASYYQTGQQIKFNYTIKNNGSTQLGPGQFTITDTGINNNAPFNCGNADATLAPGASLTCSNTYIITAADMNAASISTNAVASGGGANPSQPAAAAVAKTSPPAMAKGTNVQHKVIDGEWLWQIARCYGADPAKTIAANTQLANTAQLKEGMTVNVPNIGSNGEIHAPPQPCVTKYVVVTGDTWSSIASKYGADPGFLQYVNSNTLTVGKAVKVPHYTAGMNYPIPSTTTATNTPAPSTTGLALTVSANPTTYSQAGQVITYTYIVKNSGTTTLGPTQFTVTDGLMNPATFNCGPAGTTLSSGASTTCNVNYTISQEDLNDATISNNATATGAGAPTSAAAVTTISKSVTQLTLSAIPNPATYNAAGQVITVTYIIKNNGTSTLGPAQFNVTDGLIQTAPISCGPPNTTLAPATTVTCTGTYTVLADDLNDATLSSSAIASGGGAPNSQAAPYTLTKQ